MRSLVLVASLFALSSLAAPAGAQAPSDEPGPSASDAAATARARYGAGARAYEQKRFVEAALFFEAAAVDKPHAVALFTAALAWEQANQPERAADDYARCILVQGLALDKLMQAKERLAALRAVLGHVEVSGPEGWRVQLDALTEVALPAVLHGTAGVHRLSVRAPDRPLETREVVLELGTSTRLELSKTPASDPRREDGAPSSVAAVVAAAPASTSPVAASPAESGLGTRRTLGVLALGLGSATLLGGVLLGVSALDAKDAYVANPTASAFDHAASLETWTNVALVSGAVLTVGGAALVLWPSPTADKGRAAKGARAPRVSVAPTATGLLVRGSF